MTASLLPQAFGCFGGALRAARADHDRNTGHCPAQCEPEAERTGAADDGDGVPHPRELLAPGHSGEP
jgi:hypothetical protein